MRATKYVSPSTDWYIAIIPIGLGFSSLTHVKMHTSNSFNAAVHSTDHLAISEDFLRKASIGATYYLN